MANRFNEQYGKFGLSAGITDAGRIGIFDTGEFTGRSGIHGVADESAFTQRFGQIIDPIRRSNTSLANLPFERIISGAQGQFESKQAMALADQQAQEFNQRLQTATPGDVVGLPGSTAFTIDPSGAPRTAQGMQRLQQAGQGDVVEISPGKFVPVGSPAAQFPQGVAGALAQQAATPQVSSSPFVNVMGAFFEQTDQGLKSVTDPQMLVNLATGKIASTTKQSTVGQPVGILPDDISTAKTGLNIPVDKVSTNDLGSSLTRSDVLRKVGGMQSYIDQLRDIQQREVAARQGLSNLQISGLQGVANIRDQAIPMPLIGQQAALLEQQIAMQALPLEQRLETLALEKGNAIETINLAMELQKMTRPDVLSTEVNKTTGDLIAVVQDPQTGTVSSQVVGNVGADASKDYIAQSVAFDHSRGQDVFRGVNADGTVDIIPLGTTSKTSGSGGGGEEEMLSINQIEQFRRSYGWTPPFGYTESQLLQFMQDNPTLSGEELEEIAGSVTKDDQSGIDKLIASTDRNSFEGLSARIAKARELGASDEEIREQVLSDYTTDELFAISKEQGLAKVFSTKKTDINRMLDILI